MEIMLIFLRVIFIFVLVTFVSGCAEIVGLPLQAGVESRRQAECKFEECIVPDMYEFTFGAAYEKKYMEGYAKGKCVKIIGKVIKITQGNLNLPLADDSYILLWLSVEKATRPLAIYAKLSFSDKFRNIKNDEVVTIYGRSVFVFSEQNFSVLMSGIMTGDSALK